MCFQMSYTHTLTLLGSVLELTLNIVNSIAESSNSSVDFVVVGQLQILAFAVSKSAMWVWAQTPLPEILDMSSGILHSDSTIVYIYKEGEETRGNLSRGTEREYL